MNVFYENFGLRPFQVEKNKIIYGEKIEGGKHIIMTVFQAFSGIDIKLLHIAYELLEYLMDNVYGQGGSY